MGERLWSTVKYTKTSLLCSFGLAKIGLVVLDTVKWDGLGDKCGRAALVDS